jgi:DNA-binding SARP family transcriptional activator
MSITLTEVRTLEVRCLGTFGVYDGERRLGPWTGRRPKALLKHLVLHRHRPVPREQLMEAFWPEASPAAARNNLHGAVHALRRFLREAHGDVEHVVHEDGCYALDPDLPVWDDVSEFERLAREARRGGPDAALGLLEAADELYLGPLFEDDPYEEWMQPRRRELEAVHLEVLDLLREQHRERGALHAWAAAARRIVASEPWREDVQRELMTCLARQGRHALALRQYGECATALRGAFGLAPDAETEELRVRISRRATL